MLITYFDEVKYAQGKQPYYWLGGISLSAESIYGLEAQVGAIAKECFGTANLSKSTEFHASDIYHRKANFKEWRDPVKRVEILKRLLLVLSEAKPTKIYSRIEPARMVAADIEQKAFLFFVERVEWQLRAAKQPGILIGDRENAKGANIFAETLSRYRSGGTPYAYGTDLTHLIDTVHFTDSHHSRMLQLADLYVWSLQFCANPSPDKYQTQLIEFIRNETNVLMPSACKVWPTSQSWIQVGAV